MDKLWRSNSSISSRTGCPPVIVNEEDHTVEEHEILDFRKWNIPKVDTKTIYKTSFVESVFHSAYKARTVEQIFSISRVHEKCCLFTKRNIVTSLLLKNSVICILVWFKLLLNHSPERVLMLLFSCVYVMLDLKILKIAFLV